MFFASFNRGVGQGGATFRSLILQKKQRIIKDQKHFQKQPWKLIRTNDFFLLTRLLAAATAPSISDMFVKPMKCQQKACCDPTAIATQGAATKRLAATQPRLRRMERRQGASHSCCDASAVATQPWHCAAQGLCVPTAVESQARLRRKPKNGSFISLCFGAQEVPDFDLDQKLHFLILK